MRAVGIRVRAFAGLWSLLALLTAGLVFASAAGAPFLRHTEDRALGMAVAHAPSSIRDIVVTEPAEGAPAAVGDAHEELRPLLPEALAQQIGAELGILRTRVVRPGVAVPSQFASLTGEGVRAEPAGYLPLVGLHYQHAAAERVRMMAGRPPVSDPGGGLAVMASTGVAEALGLRVGGTYHLLAGDGPRFPLPASRAEGPTVAVTVTGIFEPRDRDAAGWEFDPLLLTPSQREWPLVAGSTDTVPLRQATLLTDRAGIQTLLDRGLDPYFGVERVALFRVDPDRLSADWAAAGTAAVAQLTTDARLRPQQRVQTGLPRLLDDYQRQIAAVRAVAAVAATGVAGTGVGLLALAAGLAADRRRPERQLLRARGASQVRVAGRLLAEAALVMLPAAVIGWLVHLGLPGAPDPRPVAAAAPLVTAALALLAVPATVVVADRRWRRPDSTGRVEVARHRPAPARLTAEAAVLLLAMLGVVLLHRRGLAPAGIDLYLSAVPVLIGAAAGLLALRLLPWPLRLAAAVAARGRRVVGFLGLAGASRAAPVTALPALILVLAAAVGGFAGAVHASVTAAHDAAALRAVGAQARLTVDGLGPGRPGELSEAELAAVAAVPGVTAVSPLSREGHAFTPRGFAPDIAVLVVDAPAYQRILAEVGVSGRLPDELVEARPGPGPLPVLSSIPDPTDQPTAVRIDEVEYAVTVVGGPGELPALSGSRSWLLVPRQALTDPPPAGELLIGGAGVEPAALRDAVSREPAEVGVLTLAQQRALAAGGLQGGLTTILVGATVGAAVAGLLAVGLALVVQAAARRQTVSALRTIGLSRRQARGLLWVELLPVAGAAVAVGALVGVLTPMLLASALGLTEFSGGAALPLGAALPFAAPVSL